jgi:hypothetical protein
MKDAIIERLCRPKQISFVEATDEVVEGYELRSSGNQFHGKNVYVSTGGDYQPEPKSLITGKDIEAGAREPFLGCELRCDLINGALGAALSASDGTAMTRRLISRSIETASADEGSFVWFGPVEDINTPWSDGGLPQCQVITIERLRTYARTLPVRAARAQLKDALEAAHPQQSLQQVVTQQMADTLPPNLAAAFRACLATTSDFYQSHGLDTMLRDVFNDDLNRAWIELGSQLPITLNSAQRLEKAKELSRKSYERHGFDARERRIKKESRAALFVFISQSVK